MDVCESTPLVGPSTNTHHDSRTTGNNERKNDTYKRRLGLLDGVALVLGLQIGSGIFASPSLVVRRAGSELAALAIWCCAGILTWACAACYIELGTRMPVNGGPQEYISNNLNELTGLFAAYGCIFIIKPSSAAILALVIAEYLCAAFSLEGRFVQKLASLCIVAAITTVNCLGNRISGLTTKAFLACKVIAISAVILAGLVVLICPGSHDHLGNPQYRSRKLSDYADATLSAMWSYSGWETLAYVGGELLNPRRNTPLVINISMTIVLFLSIFANISYFAVIPFDEIVRSNTIGLTFSMRLLGRIGSTVYAVVICLSTLGALNVKTFTAGRLTQAAAQRRWLPGILETVGDQKSCGILSSAETSSQQQELAFMKGPMRFKDGSIPFSAIVFNSLLAAGYILVGDFASLITFFGVMEYSIVFLSLLGLLILRIRIRPHERISDSVSFRVPFILILLASTTTALVVLNSIIGHPISGLGLVLCYALSAFMYYRLQRGDGGVATIDHGDDRDRASSSDFNVASLG